MLKRPPVPVKHRGCESNLLEGRTTTNIATWNVRTLNDETDFKLQNLSSEKKRLKIEILGTTEKHWTNEMAKVFE